MDHKTLIQRIQEKPMDLNAYQISAAAFVAYPKDKALDYLHLALCEEAGEAAGKRAKALRQRGTVDPYAMAHELGDVLWNLANLADEYGFSLNEIAEMNLEKLRDRSKRNVINGVGDNR